MHDKQWQLLAKLAERGWAPIKNHKLKEVADLVHNHVAFVLVGPFDAYVLPEGVHEEAQKHPMLLPPTSKMLRIALRDQLCQVANLEKLPCRFCFLFDVRTPCLEP
eukprot:6425866-Amphidinium_carterae.1